MKTNRLHVSGDLPEFIVTNKSGVAYKVRLDLHGTGSCTCPDFQVRIAQEGGFVSTLPRRRSLR